MAGGGSFADADPSLPPRLSVTLRHKQQKKNFYAGFYGV